MTIATTTPTPNAVPKSDGSGTLDAGWFPAGTIDAEDVAFTPAGGVAATDVQAAIAELDTEKATTGSVSTVATNLSNHLADATDAHDASAISFVSGGALVATEVNGAIDELEGMIVGFGDAQTSDGLDQFAATTSAELAGVISDETGSGNLVFATSPTLVTPVLGVAAATTVNKVALTAPATGATLTIADGATLTVSASATITNGTHSGTNTGDQTNISGNAATVTFADAGGDTTTFVALGTAATGSLAPATDAGLTYNATTNVLTVAGSVAANVTGDVTGNLTGNADTATNLTGLTASVAELNTLDGITASTAELNILDGVTADASELNALDGITATVTELNYTDGVTSSIQTQLNAKQPLDAELTAIAGLTSAADKGIQFTGSGTAATYDLTTAGKALLDDASAAAQATTLGLGTGDSPQFTALNIGHASDTTITRVSAGVAAVEGKSIALNGTGEVLTTGTIELGAASDTTIARSGAGDITVEGNALYRAGGTDVPVTDGGTGASTAATARVNLGIALDQRVLTIDGGGSVPTTGKKGHYIWQFACTVTGWTIFSGDDSSGSAVIDVWAGTYASMPTSASNSIAGSEKPTLSSAAKNQDLSLSTWTVAVAAGDVWIFNLDSASTLTKIELFVHYTR